MPALTYDDMQEIMEDVSDNAKETVRCEIERKSINCPLVAVPEKIIFCIDISQDHSHKPYILKDDSSCSPFDILKKIVSSFVNNKHTFNVEHEFAVMSLEPGGAKWVHDFSNDPKEIVNAVNDLELTHLAKPQEVNLTTIFEELHKHIGDLPQVRVNTVQFPKHIIRLVLLYNSSYNIPKMDDSETFSVLASSEYFRWDIMYLHDAPSAENKCQDVYNVLLKVSPPNSHIFESSRKVVKVFNCMAQLLAHPLQRVETYV